MIKIVPRLITCLFLSAFDGLFRVPTGPIKRLDTVVSTAMGFNAARAWIPRVRRLLKGCERASHVARRSRPVAVSFERAAPSARSWSAAVLCRFRWSVPGNADLTQSLQPAPDIGGYCQHEISKLGHRLKTGGVAFNDPFGDCMTGEPGHIVNAKFVHHLLAVLLDRFNTDAKFGRDLFVGAALGD